MKCPFCIKVCSKCNKILIAYKGNFSKQKNGKYGLRANCKECQKKYKEDNKEHYKKYNKQYREANKEYFSEYNKKYYEDNKEYFSEYKKQWYKDNKEYFLEHCKEYYKNNPDKLFNHNTKRRQLEENQGNGINKAQWLEMMEFFEWKCAYSGIDLNKDNRSIDHIIPLVKGGKHEIWNCVPCYANYNYTKHTSDMIDWYKQQDFYSEERLQKIYNWIKYAYNKYYNNF